MVSYQTSFSTGELEAQPAYMQALENLVSSHFCSVLHAAVPLSQWGVVHTRAHAHAHNTHAHSDPGLFSTPQLAGQASLPCEAFSTMAGRVRYFVLHALLGPGLISHLCCVTSICLSGALTRLYAAERRGASPWSPVLLACGKGSIIQQEFSTSWMSRWIDGWMNGQ